MNSQKYLEELGRALSFMSREDREEALEYYKEYFMDAGSENAGEIINELGTPAKLASDIRIEYESGKKEPSGWDLAVWGSEKRSQSGAKAPFGKYRDPNIRSPLGNDPFADERKKQESERVDGEYRYSTNNQRWDNQESTYSGSAPYGSTQWYQQGGNKREEGAPAYGSRAYQDAWEDLSGKAKNAGRQVRDEYVKRRDSYRQKKEENETENSGENYSYTYNHNHDNNGYQNRKPEKKPMTVGRFIGLLCLFLFLIIPIVIPLIGAAFVVVIALFITFLVTGIALLAGGVSVIVAAIITFANSANTMLLIGIALIAMSIGIPVLILGTKVAGKALGGLVKALKSIFSGKSSKEANNG